MERLALFVKLTTLVVGAQGTVLEAGRTRDDAACSTLENDTQQYSSGDIFCGPVPVQRWMPCDLGPLTSTQPVVMFYICVRLLCCTTQLVLAVPKGVTLTAVMDCCSSGTIVDLPYHIAANEISAGKDFYIVNSNPCFSLER